MTDARDTARELQLTACLHEVLGMDLPTSLEQRIALRLRSASHVTSTRAHRRHRIAAAALLLLGVGAVAGVALLRSLDERNRAAEQPAAPPEQQDPPRQDPKGQDPKPDPATEAALQKRIDQCLRDLELPERRAAALAVLNEIGPAAATTLRQAIAGERARGRDEMALVLQSALVGLDHAEAKRMFGLPPEPVTFVADYSDNCVLALSAKGDQLWRLDDVFGPWDIELCPGGTVLVTQFSVSEVAEFDRAGKKVWSFTNLKNPYDADRLPNGNTLIADTFASRVIEVNSKGEIVWKFDKDIRPFDCDRLPSGNTLIADVRHDRVIEVDPDGKVVWEVRNMGNVHDADRLPNGNTLITLRSKGTVLEVDRDGKTVWELKGLRSPSDADRLPSGHTLVAEHGCVREFDRAGNEVWRREGTWVVEVGRW